MNFDKHYSTYEKNSLAQRQVAEHLLSYMKDADILKSDVNSIFEIGCGTGIFTREYRKFFPKSSLILNDIFDVKSFIKDINYNIFIKENIEEIDIPKSDLVVSSSVFQWIDGLEDLIRNIAENTDILCFSTYVFGNLLEIKNHFELEEIEKIIATYFQKFKTYKETIKIDFENPLSLLRHLKYTGVTGFQRAPFSKIKSFKDNCLTYEVAYFICQK